MSRIRQEVRAVAVVVGLALLHVSVTATSARSEDEPFSPYVDPSGEIRLPDDFRASMVHLGSWFVPEGAASGFHDVYTERQSAAAFRENGVFPDGATLVKELRTPATSDYTTGAGVSHATSSVKQWFVMVKDERGRFPESKVWGDGWGWALFQPGNPATNAATNYQTDCLGCHIPAKSSDWVYTHAYPTLHK